MFIKSFFWENQTSKTQHPQTEQFVNTDATVSTREKRGEERLVTD